MPSPLAVMGRELDRRQPRIQRVKLAVALCLATVLFGLLAAASPPVSCSIATARHERIVTMPDGPYPYSCRSATCSATFHNRRDHTVHEKHCVHLKEEEAMTRMRRAARAKAEQEDVLEIRKHRVRNRSAILVSVLKSFRST